MNISSVKNLNYIHHKTSNFKGVWGETISCCPDYDPIIASTKITKEAYYFPFLDETNSEVDEVVRKNTSSRLASGPDGKRQYIIQNCKVCAPIQIKKDLYERYVSIKDEDSFDSSLVYPHVLLRDKFFNSGFQEGDKEQRPIANQVVISAITKAMEKGYLDTQA